MDLPSEPALRWIVTRYARLRAAYGAAIGDPPLVQPTGEYFPDEFRRDAASVERLLRRMIGHAPLADDLGIELGFLAPEGDGHAGGGCGSAACGTSGAAATRAAVQEVDGAYRVLVPVNDVANPDVLTTTLARAVGALVLFEGGEEEPELDAEAEMAAVLSGFGVLLVNGAAVWAKSCGGLRMAQATELSVDEAAVALALFVAVHRLKPSLATAHAGATQREALDRAMAWVESNPLLVEGLRDRPELLQGGAFTLEPTRGVLGRWLHKRKVEREGEAAAGREPDLGGQAPPASPRRGRSSTRCSAGGE